jgi:hypothetical protein
VIVVSVAFLVAALYSDTENVAWALALLALSYPVYYALKALGRFGAR